MNYAQPPYGPYAGYQTMGVDPAAFDPTGHHPKVRIWFVLTALLSGLFYLGGFIMLVVGVLIKDRDLTPIIAGLGYVVLLLGALLLYVKAGLALYWLHGAWKWVPLNQRIGKDGKRISPGDVFMLLIPYYNWYWMFPINLSLCDIMERLRAGWVNAPPSEAPPRDTTMWAAICELIPFANFFVAPFLWGSYMRRVDLLHEEIMAARAVRQP